MERIAQDGLPEHVTEMTAMLKAKVKRKSGEIEDLGVVCRKSISNIFKQILVKSMVTANTTEQALLKDYKYHEWGTSSAAEAATQGGCIAQAATTTFISEALLDSGNQAASYTPPTFTYTTVCELTSVGTVTITEHCVHPTRLLDDINGMDRNVFTGIPLTTGDSITFTYVLSFTG